jgi:hypothetical protein
MTDKASKGRSIRGERNNIAVLVAEQVVEIRARVAAGERQIDVARAFGVSPTAVCLIVSRKNWKHID